MDKNNIEVVVLAGGQSKRMQSDKAMLKYKNKTFLTTIIDELSKKYYVNISHNKNKNYSNYINNKILDLYEDIGPIGGIYSSILSCEKDNIFVVACDTINIKCELISFLSSYINEYTDIIIPVDREGKIFPTAGIYNRNIQRIIKHQIENQDYRLMNLLDKAKTKYVYLEHTVFDDDILCNINTKEQYYNFLEKNKEPIMIAISGVKNSGKTTMITKLIPVLNARGYRVATIKHDGHDFDYDTKDTDTFKHYNAGAYGVSIFSKNKFFIIKNESVDEEFIKHYFSNVDIILLEGFKNSKYKKIEIVRESVSSEPICDTDSLLGIATNCMYEYKNISIFDINDINGISEKIHNYVLSKK